MDKWSVRENKWVEEIKKIKGQISITKNLSNCLEKYEVEKPFSLSSGLKFFVVCP